MGWFRSFYRRLVVPQGGVLSDGLTIRSGLPGGRMTLAPFDAASPQAAHKPRPFRILIYDGRHMEAAGGGTAETWLGMARLEIVRASIPTSSIARRGPAGTLGFLAWGDEGDIASIRGIMRSLRLFPFSVEIAEDSPRNAHAPQRSALSDRTQRETPPRTIGP